LLAWDRPTGHQTLQCIYTPAQKLDCQAGSFDCCIRGVTSWHVTKQMIAMANTPPTKGLSSALAQPWSNPGSESRLDGSASAPTSATVRSDPHLAGPSSGAWKGPPLAGRRPTDRDRDRSRTRIRQRPVRCLRQDFQRVGGGLEDEDLLIIRDASKAGLTVFCLL
jgi:hypothetical protein